jgi:hypothetical protein
MTRHDVILTVGLKVVDNEARSALEALQAKMGLRDSIAGLAREELWEIGVDAETPESAVETVAGLVKTTNLFANPNKHSFSLRARSKAGGAAATGSAVLGRDLSEEEIAILVTGREATDGESVLSAVRRAGVGSVMHVRKWTRWRVLLSRRPERSDPHLDELVRAIGVTTGRRQGLLSNPHSQISIAVMPWGEEKPLAD